MWLNPHLAKGRTVLESSSAREQRGGPELGRDAVRMRAETF